MEYLAYAFDHTLSGPFNKLLSVWFSASQTLCIAHFLFLSPLQRFEVLLCYLIIALLYNAFFYLSSVIFIIYPLSVTIIFSPNAFSRHLDGAYPVHLRNCLEKCTGLLYPHLSAISSIVRFVCANIRLACPIRL